MSTQQWFWTVTVSSLLALSMVACASTKTTALRVAGTDGAEFMVYYDAAGMSGAIKSIARPDSPVTVIELPGYGFRSDVRKSERQAHLDVSVYRGEEQVVQTFLPPGTEGVRIRQVAGAWRTEIY